MGDTNSDNQDNTSAPQVSVGGKAFGFEGEEGLFAHKGKASLAFAGVATAGLAASTLKFGIGKTLLGTAALGIAGLSLGNLDVLFSDNPKKWEAVGNAVKHDIGDLGNTFRNAANQIMGMPAKDQAVLAGSAVALTATLWGGKTPLVGGFIRTAGFASLAGAGVYAAERNGIGIIDAAKGLSDGVGLPDGLNRVGQMIGLK